MTTPHEDQQQYIPRDKNADYQNINTNPISDMFEGPNSSLHKTWEGAVSEETTVEDIISEIDAILDGDVHSKCAYSTYSELKDLVALIPAKLASRERDVPKGVEEMLFEQGIFYEDEDLCVRSRNVPSTILNFIKYYGNARYDEGVKAEATRRDGIERAIEHSIIDQHVTMAVQEERERIVREIQKIADTTRPNLLLNEIVNRFSN